jgi:hypothetical protein
MLVGSSLANGTAAASLCITQAENEIRKILSERYDVSAAEFQTSTSTPPMVQDICLWLSLGYFFQLSSRGGKESIERGKTFIKQAMDNLFQIANREASLVSSSGSLIDEIGNYMGMTSTTKNYAPTFNEDDPLEWAADPDKLDDIFDERS